jgi:hypothetical protein
VAVTTEQRVQLIVQVLQEIGDARGGGLNLKDPTCDCHTHREIRRLAARQKQEKDRLAALQAGNKIEFVRITREILEADGERGGAAESTERLNARAVDLIKALEKGWEPIPDKDPMTIMEEHSMPAYEALQDSVMQFLVEAFGDE